MNLKRVFMDVILVAVIVAVGLFCYSRGKAYNFVLDNTASVNGSQTLEAMEAVSVKVDGENEKVLYADDRDITVAIGSGEHVLRIDNLDLNDVPIPGEGREYTFNLAEMGDKPIVNIPSAYANGKPVK